MIELTLKDYCKKNYNTDVKTLADNSGVPRRTLNDWWNSEARRTAIKLMLDGIVARKNCNTESLA